MACFKYEVRKLFSKSSSVLILLMSFLIGFGFLYLEQSQRNHPLVKHHSIYQEIDTKMQDLSLSQKSEWLKKETTFYQNVSAYEQQLHLQAITNEEVEIMDESFLDAYEHFLQSEEYQNYPDRLAVLMYLEEYYEQLLHYDDYLLQIKDNTKFQLSGPMSYTMDTNDRASLAIKLGRYQRLHAQRLADQGFLTMDQYANSSISIVSLVLWLVLTFFVLHSDESSDMEELMETTRFGKHHARMIKLVVVLLSGIVLTCLLHAVWFLFLSVQYGSVDTSMALQSIPTFYTSYYCGSIQEWLVEGLVLKILSGFCLSSFFMLLYAWLKKFALVCFGLVYGVSLALYVMISENSIFHLFHDINFYTISNIHLWFHDLSLFSLFGNFISKEMLIFAIMIALGIISVIGYSLLFHTFKYKLPSISMSPLFAHCSLFLHEFQKLIFNNRFFILSFMLVLYYVFSMTSLSMKHISTPVEEKAFALYETYQGALNDEKRNEIEKRYAFYQQQEEAREQWLLDKENGVLSEEEYQDKLTSYMQQASERSAFHIFYKDYQLAQKEVVYKKGYQAIFAMNNDARDIRASMILIGVLIFTFYGIWSFDLQKREIILYETTKYGRQRLHISKYIVMLLFASALFLLFQSIEFFVFQSIYPMFQWNASLQEIIPDGLTITTPLSLSMTCKQYFICLLLVKWVGVLFVTNLIYLFSKHLPNLIMCCFISLVVLLLPMALYYNGFEGILMFSLFDMIQGNLYLYKSMQFSKVLICTILVIYNLMTIFLGDMRMPKKKG